MATLQPNKDQEVTISQQGSLKAKEEVISVTATGTFSGTETVPVGKKWLLKGITSSRSTGNFTITRCDLNGTIDTLGIKLTKCAMDSNNGYLRCGEQNILLPAGTVLTFYIDCSAHTTTGNYSIRYDYIETDL